MSSILDQIPNVEIDPEGVFKYVLIRVYAPQAADGTEHSKVIVRGNRRGAYHGTCFMYNILRFHTVATIKNYCYCFNNYKRFLQL